MLAGTLAEVVVEGVRKITPAITRQKTPTMNKLESKVW
jgi:hypothetical protein